MFYIVPSPIELIIGQVHKPLTEDTDAYAYFNAVANNSPSTERWTEGYIFDEKVPASDWNWTFGQVTKLLFRIRKDVYSSCNEMMNFIKTEFPDAGFTNTDDVNDSMSGTNHQLNDTVRTVVYKDRKVIAGSQQDIPSQYKSPLGSVASSNANGKVSVDQTTGVMTANGLGDVATVGSIVNPNGATTIAAILANIMNVMYPVGSIYTTTALSTPAQVAAKFGGTWEAYGQGRVLVGAGKGNDGVTEKTFTSGATGGLYSVVLASSQIPAHDHNIVIDNNGNHSHTVTIDSAGSHTHGPGTYRITGTYTATQLTYDGGGTHVSGAFYDGGYGSNAGTEDARGSSRIIGFDAHGPNYVGYTYTPSNWTGSCGSSGAHYHTNTVTTDGLHAHNATVNDSGKTRGGSHTNEQPYVVVYMYRRTA